MVLIFCDDSGLNLVIRKTTAYRCRALSEKWRDARSAGVVCTSITAGACRSFADRWRVTKLGRASSPHVIRSWFWYVRKAIDLSIQKPFDFFFYDVWINFYSTKLYFSWFFSLKILKYAQKSTRFEIYR